MRNLLMSLGLLLTPIALNAQEVPPGDGGTNEPPVVVPDCRESIRANGQIVTGDERRERAQFNVRSDEARNGNISGRLVFRDKGSGITINSRRLVGQEQVDAQTRRLTFEVDGNNGTGTAVVTVRDLGRSRDDFFELSVGEGEFLASGNLRSGNVRLKRKGRGCDDVIIE